MQASKLVLLNVVVLGLLNSAVAFFNPSSIQPKSFGLSKVPSSVTISEENLQCSIFPAFLIGYQYTDDCSAFLSNSDNNPDLGDAYFAALCQDTGPCFTDYSKVVNTLAESSEAGCNLLAGSLEVNCAYDEDNALYCGELLEGDAISNYLNCTTEELTCCTDAVNSVIPEAPNNEDLCALQGASLPQYSACTKVTWGPGTIPLPDDGNNDGSDNGGSDSGDVQFCSGAQDLAASIITNSTCLEEIQKEDTDYSILCEDPCVSDFELLQNAINQLSGTGCKFLAQVAVVSCEYDTDAQDYCGNLLSNYNGTCEESFGCCAESAFAALGDLAGELPSPYNIYVGQFISSFSSDVVCEGVDTSGFTSTICEDSTLTLFQNPFSGAATSMNNAKLMMISAFVIIFTLMLV